MKILVIQLARFGDILMTWPQIRALKRLHPEATIDILVRPRFKPACQRLQEIHRVIDFPVTNIFEPLLEEPLKLEESLDVIDGLIKKLKTESYDWIINSTLSPASSYLTQCLQSDTTKVSGYTRTSDGYLAIPDDVSAYIYAQVGIDRDNRIHLSDLFTLMVGAQPTYEDWATPVNEESPLGLTEYIVLHVGASRPEKRFSAFKWRTFISHFQKISQCPIILIGSEEETKDSSFIALGFDSHQVCDMTGKLSFDQLFPLIARAKVYLGCDSAPLHIASLVGTPTLNISLGTVNFWETGPKAKGSRVLFAETEADLPSEKVAQELMNLLNGTEAPHDTIMLIEGSPSYRAPANIRNSDWIWSYLQALYMGANWPPLATNTQRQGLKNLLDVNRIIIEQLQTIRKTGNLKTVSGIVLRCEEVIESIGNLVPELRALIRWYQTQKSLIGPGNTEAVLSATEKVHTDLENIIEYWLNSDSQITEDLNGSSRT